MKYQYHTITSRVKEEGQASSIESCQLACRLEIHSQYRSQTVPVAIIWSSVRSSVIFVFCRYVRPSRSGRTTKEGRGTKNDWVMVFFVCSQPLKIGRNTKEHTGTKPTAIQLQSWADGWRGIDCYSVRASRASKCRGRQRDYQLLSPTPYCIYFE